MSPNLHTYDHIILFFSGGKDSLASLLHLLHLGADPAKLQLWHHLIDGPDDIFFDWPCTPAYCQAIADHLHLPLFFSWKAGGFRGELLRQNAPTAPISFQTPHGQITVSGTRPKLHTRRRWPAPTADLRRRWCSAYLKIDVATAALRHHPDLQTSAGRGQRILTVSGERAQESPNRSRYAPFEPDRADNRQGQRQPRHIDRWRPLHAWPIEQVWSIIEQHKISPHPCYHLGWGRCSCMLCIFGHADQWATARHIAPNQFQHAAAYETEFNWTIQQNHSIIALADRGRPYPTDPTWTHLALSPTYTYPNGKSGPVIADPWLLPIGAYGHQHGPI